MTLDEPIVSKTKELCQTILDQPSFRSIRQRIDTFLEDGQARTQYEDLVSRGQALQEKQQAAQPLSDQEIKDFEQGRTALLNNPVARGFLDAQEELHHYQHSITRYVKKALELGRVPSEAEMQEGCGHGGCGCSH